MKYSFLYLKSVQSGGDDIPSLPGRRQLSRIVCTREADTFAHTIHCTETDHTFYQSSPRHEGRLGFIPCTTFWFELAYAANLWLCH